MLDLSKALFSKIELESFNNFLNQLLTDKNINFKNTKPDLLYISENTKQCRKSIQLQWEFQEGELRYIYSLTIEIINEKIDNISFNFYHRLYGKSVLLTDIYMTNKNIRLLMQIFYKWTSIKIKQYKYDYNKEKTK